MGMTKDELISEIALFCAGESYSTAEPIYTRFMELSKDDVDDALEDLMVIGKIEATIVRQDLMDGQLRTITNIRGL